MDLIHIALLFLSVFDILAGIAIVFPDYSPYLFFLVFFLAIIHVVKGGWSILTALAGGFKYDLLGIVDLLTGAVMFAIYSGISYNFFWIVGVAVLLKGIWSFIFSLS